MNVSLQGNWKNWHAKLGRVGGDLGKREISESGAIRESALFNCPCTNFHRKPRIVMVI